MKIILKIVKWLLLIILAAIIIIAILNALPFTLGKVTKDNVFRTEDGLPLVIPHGGAKDLAPENTRYAFDMLVNEMEADVLEIDLALTKDNLLIAHHNLNLEFSTQSAMNDSLIKDHTYQEIIEEYQRDDYYLARNFTYPDDYRDGISPFANEQDESILETLVPANLESDIFQQYGDTVLYILEIKDSPSSINYEAGSDRFELAAQTLIDLINKYELEDKVVLASFSDEVTSYFKEHAPDMLIGAAYDEVTNFAIVSAFHIDFFWQAQSEVLILPNKTSMDPITGSTAELMDKIPSFFRDSIGEKEGDAYLPNLAHKQLVNDAHRKNMAAIYWTINDPEEMRHLIEIGVDGIITDRPDLLNEVISEFSTRQR